jgi:hypothetical protein
MRAELVVEALEMAVRRRKPEAGLVHHSDQARSTSRCASVSAAALRASGSRWARGPRRSTTAACEAFFGSLERERLNRRSWPTSREARSAIFEWIEGWYNPRRLHSRVGYPSPNNYEQLIFDAARLKRRLNALGTAKVAAVLSLVGVNAALGQTNFRRPPARRLLRRRYRGRPRRPRLATARRSVPDEPPEFGHGLIGFAGRPLPRASAQ